MPPAAPQLRLVRLLFAGALALLPQVAEASCGLDMCPIDAAPDVVPPRVRLQSQTRHTEAPDGAAWYVEEFVGAQVVAVRRPGAELRLGASLPVIWLRDATGPWTGLGNTIALAELGLHRGEARGEVALGTQLELPTTTRDTHDDAGNTVLLPYLRGMVARGPVDLSARVGWARSVGGAAAGHSHDDLGFLPTVEVNPHSDSELLQRLELGLLLRPGAVSLRPALAAQLIEELGPQGILVPSGGPALDLFAGPVRMRAQAWLPLSTAHQRFDRRLNLVVAYEPRKTL